MIVYRITSKPYARDLSGTGAMLYGGRWNPKGVRMLYTSQTLSLAVLEMIANLSGDKLGTGLVCTKLEFPDTVKVHEPKLPDDWRAFLHGASSVLIGLKFIENGGFCMKVPSALVPTEFNYLLNPIHEDFDQVKYLDSNPLLLDQRLLNR